MFVALTLLATGSSVAWKTGAAVAVDLVDAGRPFGTRRRLTLVNIC